MKVLITDPIDEMGVRILKEAGFDVSFNPGLKGDALADIIGDYDALIVRSSTRVTREIIEKASRLKVIGRAGVGLDNIDIEAAKQRGIEILNSPEATSISVAELTIGLMLSLARQIPNAHKSVKSGKWEKKKFKGVELYGKTLGIIGLGRIGLKVAERAKSFGMKILGYDIKEIEVEGVQIVDLEKLLRESDFITLHIPLTNSTKHLIGRREMEIMKEGAFLINAARGGIVDEEALYEFLKRKKLGGAALDVFEIEPPTNSKLLELENVIFTPHIGAQTSEGQRRASIDIARKVKEALEKFNE